MGVRMGICGALATLDFGNWFSFSNFSVENRFSVSFELAEVKFHHGCPPGKNPFRHLVEKSTIPPWKKSACEPVHELKNLS